MLVAIEKSPGTKSLGDTSEEGKRGESQEQHRICPPASKEEAQQAGRVGVGRKRSHRRSFATQRRRRQSKRLLIG